MSGEILGEVEAFLNSTNITRYLELLKDVESVCEEVKRDLGGNVVRQIYSRKNKQDNGEQLKTCPKIAKALARKRKADPNASPASIEDIIGLTVVVHYPDQIHLVTESLRSKMTPRASVVKDGHVSKDGYHAHHMVFLSDEAKHADLHCEVQVKTMLHDAWAAKTHDLNYKPQGQTDKRLSRMMQVFGDALEAIEVQSELLRHLIHERWNAEVERRSLVGKMAFDNIPVIRSKGAFGTDAIKRLEDIQSRASNPGSLTGWASTFAEVSRFARESMREGTWLALCLAIVTGQPEHVAFAGEKVDQLLRRPNSPLRSSVNNGVEIWSLPLALSACGDLEGAIETSEYIIQTYATVGEETLTVVKFNLANFLVEQTCFGSPSEHDDPAARRARIEGLIADCALLESKDPGAFHDLRGMVEVAFSDDPAILRRAIDLIYRGKQPCKADDEQVIDAYFELHTRLAWRRLLEVEAGRLEKAVAPSA